MSKVEDILASTKVGDVLDAAKLNKFLKRQEDVYKRQDHHDQGQPYGAPLSDRAISCPGGIRKSPKREKQL